MLTDIGQVRDEFQNLMTDLGIDQLKIRDENKKEVTGVNALALALPEMYLPQLMLRTDNISQALINCRVFDFGYAYDSGTLSGMKATKISQEDKEKYGYSTNVLKDTELAKIIMRHALASSITEDFGFAELKKHEDYSFREDNDLYVRPMEDNFLIATLLREFTEKAMKAVDLVLSKEFINANKKDEGGPRLK